MTTHSDFEQFFYTMMQFGKLMSQQMQETNDEKTATILQLMALQFLKEQPNKPVSDLANFLKLSKSSVAQLIERLEKIHLVKRNHDNEDRRIVRLVITEAGEKEFIALKTNLMEKMQKIFSQVPAHDIRELTRIHLNLIKTLNKE